MCQTAKHITHNQSRKGLSVYDRQDPTRTTVLRNRYAREMKKRFRWLRGIIRDAVVEKDVFGIAGGNEGIQDNQLQIYADSGLRRQAFDFPRQSDKVSAFIEWLQRQVDRGILEVRDRNRIGDSIEQTWQNIFLEDTYKRGVIRGNYELRRGGFPGVQSLDARGGINVVMGLPMHVDRLGVLYTRAFNDLKGITDAMDTQISRVLVQGLADGDGPRLIARKLSATVGGTSTQGLGITDSLGRFIPAERRAEILARTEIIRAHHHGMMQEYRNWGVEGVEVQAEFRTAGDDRVCPDCESLEGRVYSLADAQELIPVHPMCRCIVLPARPGDVTSTGRILDEEGFAEFQSIEDAENWARGKGLTVDYTDMQLDQANAINRALEEVDKLQTGIPIDKVVFKDLTEGFRSPFARISGTALEVNSLKFTDQAIRNASVYTDDIARAQRRITKAKTRLAGDEIWGESQRRALQERITQYEAIIKEYKTTPFSRVTLNKTDLIRHELGHAIHDELMLNGKKYNIYTFLSPSEMEKVGFSYEGSLAQELFPIAKREGMKLGEYAMKNDSEYFAESYVAFLKGREDLVNPRLLSIFRRLL